MTAHEHGDGQAHQHGGRAQGEQHRAGRNIGTPGYFDRLSRLGPLQGDQAGDFPGDRLLARQGFGADALEHLIPFGAGQGQFHDRLHLGAGLPGEHCEPVQHFPFFPRQGQVLQLVPGFQVGALLGVEVLHCLILLERILQQGQGVHSQGALPQSGLHARGQLGLDVVVFGDGFQALVGLLHGAQGEQGQGGQQDEHHEKAGYNTAAYAVPGSLGRRARRICLVFHGAL